MERPMIDESEAEELIRSYQRFEGDLSGERALMFAILRDAVCCIVEEGRRRHYRARALGAHAAAWMRAEDRAWPCSFVNICDVLGIDADALRARCLRAR